METRHARTLYIGTTAERTTLASTLGNIQGVKFYDTDMDYMFFWDGTAWSLRYEDLQVSISNIKPGSTAPTERQYDCGTGGLTFPFLGFAVNDFIYFDVQTNHAAKLNEALDNHIHFVLPNTTNIGDRFQFQLDVMAAGINTQWAVPAGSPYTAERQVAANDDTYHRLMEIADIAASNDTVSTVYKCKLTRIAATVNEYGSEVYLTFTDCHQLIDTPGGSYAEDSK